MYMTLQLNYFLRRYIFYMKKNMLVDEKFNFMKALAGKRKLLRRLKLFFLLKHYFIKNGNYDC